MKIAHVVAGAVSGGAELFFERLAVAQHGRGETVLPVIRRNPARASVLAGAGMAPVELAFGGWLDRGTPAQLKRHLRAFAPALVMAWMGRAAAAAPRGDWVLAGRLGGYYDLKRFRRCDHLVANTLGMVEWIARQGWPAERVHHLPNFSPDLGEGVPAVLPVPKGAPTVLAMGRLHPNKGFDVLVRALSHLPGVHVVIGGDGAERQALLDLAKSTGVTERLHLLGWREDGAALLAAATVLACPSRQEPLGNVVLEAFSARRPVVAAASDGPAELIRDGETGLLVPVEDPTSLASALAQVIEAPARAGAMAAAARTEFEIRHAEEPVLQRWRDVLPRLKKAG